MARETLPGERRKRTRNYWIDILMNLDKFCIDEQYFRYSLMYESKSYSRCKIKMTQEVLLGPILYVH